MEMEMDALLFIRRLMIDSDKKVVSKQPFVSFQKVNSLQS